MGKVSPFSGAVTYEHGWTEAPGDDVYANTAGSKAKIVFYGTGIRYISQKDTNFGKGIIYLDGKKVKEFNAHGPAERNVTIYEATGLTETVHTLTVEPAGDGTVDVIAFEVQYDKSKKIPVSRINVNAESLQMNIGAAEKLSAAIEPYNAANKNVTWSSEDETVAKVNAAGEVNALKAGTTNIIAALDSQTVKIPVTVEELVTAPMRKTVNNAHPLFIHGLYRQGNQNLPGPLQGGKDIQGFWDSLVNGDPNGYKLPAGMLENQAIVIHPSGNVNGDEQTRAWVEERIQQTKKTRSHSW
ncbi:Ig-like domain-containing protein [Arcanobacterium hippocoleae]